MRIAEVLGIPLVAQMAVPTCGGSSPPPGTSGPQLFVLAVSPATVSLSSKGTTVQLTAQLETITGLPVETLPVTWTSPNPAVVTVDSAGVATAQGEGQAVVQGSVRAKDSSAIYSGTATLSVVLEQWKFLGAITTATGATDTQLCGLGVDPRDDRAIYVAATIGLYVSATWAAPGHLPCRHHPTTPAAGRSRLIPRVPTASGTRPRGPHLPIRRQRPDVALDRDAVFDGRGHRDQPLEPGAVLVTSSSSAPGGAAIWIARDHGATWTGLPFGNARPDLVGRTDPIAWSLGEDPAHGTLYSSLEIRSHPQPYQPPLMRSTDRGASWQDVAGWNRGLPAPMIVLWHALRELVDPPTHAVLIFTEGAGLYGLLDHGATWARWGNGIFTQDLRDPNRPERYFGSEYPGGGRPGGAYVSTDSALTFTHFGLDGRQCNRLALSGDSGRLFVDCWQSGLYMTPLPW